MLAHLHHFANRLWRDEVQGDVERLLANVEVGRREGWRQWRGGVSRGGVSRGGVSGLGWARWWGLRRWEWPGWRLGWIWPGN
eukprot:6331923-Prymnesium_polylepis.1